MISVVFSFRNEEENLPVLIKRTQETIEKTGYEYEIIFVNDASPDGSWEVIKEIAKKDAKVKGIAFSRNFGQYQAISAGLKLCKGEWIIVLDCDLQDQPEEIIKLYNKAQEGYDVVLGRRENRKDRFIKKLFSNFFYSIFKYLTGTDQDSAIANFGIYRHNVISAVCSMRDNVRFFPAMIKWVGFKSTAIPITHSERFTGKTSYSFRKMLNLAINVIMSFSDKPLRLTVKFGLLVCLISILFAIYNVIQYFLGKIIVSGWTSLIISIWFLSGVIIFILGMLGLYIGKIFDKVKERPQYIIHETVNIYE